MDRSHEDVAKTRMVDLPLGVGILCLVLVAVDLRPGIVSAGPIMPSVQAEFGLSHAVASLLTAIPDLVMGALALASPWLGRHFGRDRAIVAALLVLMAAIAARGSSQSVTALLCTTFFVGAGIAIAGTLIGSFIKASFPDRSAVVMGIYAMALSGGSTLSAGITGPIAERVGWRWASGGWALLGIPAVVAWLHVHRHETRRGRLPPPPTAHRLPLGQAKAWLVGAFFACNNLLFYAYLAWIVPLFREYGVGAGTSSLLLACYTGAFMIANPIFGTLSRSRDRRMILAAASAITIVGLILTAIDPLYAPFLSIPLVAIGLGGAFTLGMTLPLDNSSGSEEAASWNALTLTIGYLVAAAGPLMVGALRDSTGRYDASLWVLALVGVLMLALTPLLRPRAVVDLQAVP